MTRAGFGFIIAGGFIYLVAGQTQVSWLYLFDAIIWSLLLLSAFLPWFSLRSLQIDCQVLLPDSAFSQRQLGGPVEGETVEVKLKVVNKGRLARHLIKLMVDCPFDEPDKRRRAFLLTSLKSGSAAVFTYTANCYRRGHYAASSATLQSSDPLGLLVRRRVLPVPLNLIVYPSYYHMQGLPAAEAAWAEWGHAVKSSAAAAEFYGSREYQPGDPLKHIHWRNTARLGRFMLKEFEQASQGSVTVAFDTRHDFGTGRETTLEYSIKIAASLSKLCADSGRTVDIIAGETPLHNAGWREAMDYLARLEVGGRAALAKLLAAPEPGRVVVYIVPAAETGLAPALLQLARVQRLVIMLLEGFVPGETLPEFLPRFKSSNLDIMSCSRGNLEAAIKKLGDSLFFSGRLLASAG